MKYTSKEYVTDEVNDFKYSSQTQFQDYPYYQQQGESDMNMNLGNQSDKDLGKKVLAGAVAVGIGLFAIGNMMGRRPTQYAQPSINPNNGAVTVPGAGAPLIINFDND